MQGRVRDVAVVAAIKSVEQVLERIEPRFVRMVRRGVKISVECLQVVFVRGTLKNARIDLSGSVKSQESVFVRELNSGRIQAERDDS